MILVDSDVFLIDLRYQRDQRFADNRAFLDRLAISGQGATTIYNLLEVCGVLSFNLNRQQLRELYTHFARRFHIRVVPNAEPRQRMPSFRVGEILSIVERRVSFGDALVAPAYADRPARGWAACARALAREASCGAYAVQGSKTSMSMPSRSRTLRVTNTEPREREMAAIRQSASWIGRPARRRRKAISA